MLHAAPPRHAHTAPGSVAQAVLYAQFEALKAHGVYLEGAVLKPNMVKNGLKAPTAPPAKVARAPDPKAPSRCIKSLP